LLYPNIYGIKSKRKWQLCWVATSIPSQVDPLAIFRLLDFSLKLSFLVIEVYKALH
jgi:hypothetical protein